MNGFYMNDIARHCRENRYATQRSLFPATLNLTTPDAVLLQELIPDLQQLGYQIEPFGKDGFVVQGTPADLEQEMKKW